MRAGGTPSVDDSSMWSDDGMAWVSIGDMTRSGRVIETDRNVTDAGIADKRLPVGEPGTVLFAMYASVGALGVLGVRATWNQALLGIEPRSGLADARFVTYWLEHLRRDLGALTRSNTQDNLNAEQVGNLPFPLLPLATQRAIADYLDTETARIDALIEKKRRMVQLLEERWQVLLDGAFNATDGIRLKRLLAAPLAYGVLVPEHDPDGVQMLRIMDLTPKGIDLDSVARIPAILSAQYRRTVLALGDLVVSVVGTLGRSAEVSSSMVGCNVNRALTRVQLLPEVPRSLVRFWFGSQQFQVLARLSTSGDSAQPTLGLGDLKNFLIGVPADTAKWPGIAAYLERERNARDRMETTLNRQIDLLIERRQALITAAVTGELNISGVAA